jgi:hypothetical protein
VPAAFLGATTIGGTVEGLGEAFAEVGAALIALEVAVGAHIPCFDEAIGLLATAQASIRTPAIQDPQANLNASASIAATLPTLDPLAYLQSLIASLQALLAQLAALDPTALLSTQISANAALQVQFSGQVSNIDLQLSALADISGILSACAVAISAALAAAAIVIASYQTMQSKLNAGPAYAFDYTGPLSGMGTALDGTAPSSGLAGATIVRATLQVVQQATPTPYAAQADVFLTS